MERKKLFRSQPSYPSDEGKVEGLKSSRVGYPPAHPIRRGGGRKVSNTVMQQEGERRQTRRKSWPDDRAVNALGPGALCFPLGCVTQDSLSSRPFKRFPRACVNHPPFDPRSETHIDAYRRISTHTLPSCCWD